MIMKVSIAMATYNGSKYIREQLDSFLSQTKLPDELVITDDCSTDDTVQIIKDFAMHSPFPVFISVNKKNLGYAGNFNAALEKTTGDLIFLSDQDDVWFPEKLEYITNIAEKNSEILIIMNDTVLTDELLNEVGLSKLQQIESAGMTIESFVMGCCCAIRRELLNICLPIPAGFKAHDNWLVEFADSLNSRKIENKVLQYYRRHESNESQFIANRTVKISRKDVLLESFKNIFDEKAPQRERHSIEQLQILVLGIKKANSSEKYEKSLQKFLYDTEEKIKVKNKRFDMRKKTLVLRVPLVFINLYGGGYKNTNGVKSVVRDIMGYPAYWFSFKKY